MVGLMLTTYNQLEDTKHTLQSLRQNTSHPYRLVIVDNASTDGTVAYLKENGYRLVENEQPVSLTEALNQGITYFLADPEITHIGWIHNDMEFYPKWLERLIDFLQDKKDIGKLAPVSLHLFGPNDPQFAEEFMASNSGVSYPGNTCPWIMPREVIEKVGLFDERFVKCGGYEDWDYNNRILEAGYNVLITQGSTVWHPAMGTRKNHDESESSGKNAELYFRKWGIHSPKV
ncbi:glycosyltransferase family 2 protein [Brevibacillus borstelensis]|uniref:glycosyltransferase family 2 protein n=1 Tax=Brevibacillus borstelensis TaxID=45462 RepID=UPI0030C12C5F